MQGDNHVNPTALRAALGRAGITQIALSRATGLSYSHVMKVCRGGRTLSDQAAFRVAHVIGCDPDLFFHPGTPRSCPRCATAARRAA